MRQINIAVFDSKDAAPVIPDGMMWFSVLAREPGESEFIETLYHENGNFYYEIGGDDVEIEEWAYLPSMSAGV